MTDKVIQAMRFIEAFLALMLGRKVPVVWGAQGAGMDDTGTIRLPKPKTGEAAELALLTRLAVHEGGHVVHTQRGWTDRLTTKELCIWNALEDARMEREQTKIYPGATLVLSRGLAEMLHDISEAVPDCIERDPSWALQIDLLLRALLTLAPHQAVRDHAPEILGQLAPAITAQQREAIDATLPILPDVRSSIEMEEVAKAFLARLEPALPPPETSHGDPADEERQNSGDSEAAPGGDAQASTNSDGEQSSDARTPAGDVPEDVGDDDSGTGGSQPRTAGEPEAAAESDGGNGSANEGSAAGETTAAGDPDGQAQGPEGSDGDGAAAATAATLDDQRGNGPSSWPEGCAQDHQDRGTSGNPAQSGGVEPEEVPQGLSDATSMATGAQAGNSESVDLGSLLRQVILARYGGDQDQADHAVDSIDLEPVSDSELDRLGRVLGAADPEGSLEELVESALSAVSQSVQSESLPGSGAGLYLASRDAHPPLEVVDTRLQGVQSRLVTVLQRELQDKRRRRTRPAHADGRIMAQRFWRLQRLGDTRVFAQRREASGIEAAATVLIDSSDSMSEQLPAAIQVGLAFSLALQRLGVRTKVVRFPGSQTITETLQRFGEPATACVDRCSGLYANGGTPTGIATKLEMEELLQQRRLKNFMAIITDDGPGDAAVLAQVLQRAEVQEVQVVGVGIGCDIRGHIPNSVSIDEVSELPDALSRLFRESIALKLAA